MEKDEGIKSDETQKQENLEKPLGNAYEKFLLSLLKEEYEKNESNYYGRERPMTEEEFLSLAAEISDGYMNEDSIIMNPVIVKKYIRDKVRGNPYAFSVALAESMGIDIYKNNEKNKKLPYPYIKLLIFLLFGVLILFILLKL